MRIIKSLIIAFSVYSRIPMPQFEWKEDDMKYILCFFPWIGAVIGMLLWLWNRVCASWEIGSLCRTMIGCSIPLLVTGGFHVDGYMDTMDAFHSYQTRERKLEILKDSHIGAFAVIMLALYGLIYAAAFSEVTKPESFRVFCCGFFLARALSGIAAVSFPPAKKDGSLYLFTSNAHKRVVKGSLYLQAAVCAGCMLMLNVKTGIVMSAGALMSLLYYYRRTKKELGGITGDTAGYFVLLSEEIMVVLAACVNIFVG